MTSQRAKNLLNLKAIQLKGVLKSTEKRSYANSTALRTMSPHRRLLGVTSYPLLGGGLRLTM